MSRISIQPVGYACGARVTGIDVAGPLTDDFTIVRCDLRGQLLSPGDVPTLEGQAVIKVPPGTQSGRVFRLREKGVKPVRGGATGDLFCRVVVETPVELNADQKGLLRKLEASLGDDGKSHNPRERSWLEGVRQFFGNIGS